MNKDCTHELLNALLDGCLDAAGEAAALKLLAEDAAARARFARMAQMHAWLSDDAAVRHSLASLPPAAARRPLPFRAWWVAAAVAAAIIILLATRLWPSGGMPEMTSVRPDAPALLAAACGNCHGDSAALLRSSAARVWPAVPADQAVPAMLRHRLTGDTPCAQAVSAEHRSALLQ